MAYWSAERIHEWLMRMLHAKYVEDQQGSMKWYVKLEESESHPAGQDIVRGCERLAAHGWVEVLTQAYGHVFVRMTAAGCERWEAFVEEKRTNPTAGLS